MRLRGCSVCAGVVVFSTTPWHVRNITSPPSGVKKRRTRKKNGGGWVFAFQGLAPSVKGHGPSGNTLKVLKSSTYNMYFKSYLVLRGVDVTRRTPSAENAKPETRTRVKECGECAMGACDQKHTSHTAKSPSALTVKGSSSPLMKKRREERKNQREKRSKEVNPLALLKLL